jgi:Delta-aminolevulinic acid dehydratase
MVKPALPNLDVIKVVSEEYDLPVFCISSEWRVFNADEWY